MSRKQGIVLSNVIPKDMAKKTIELIKNFKTYLKEDKKVEMGDLSEFGGMSSLTGVFTDGSNVVAERRGSGVALFSVASLIFDVDSDRLSFIDKYILPPGTAVMILVPRFYLGTRANTIMRGMEYNVVRFLIEKRNVDIAVFDGSYASALLAPRWGIEHLYGDIKQLLRSGEENEKSFLNKFQIMCEDIGTQVSRFLEDIYREGDPQEVLSRFVWEYPNIITKVFSFILDKYEVPTKAEISLLNFLSMFLENNFAARALKDLLETAEKRKVFLLWVNKEPESRVLTRKIGEKIFSIFTDAMVLDYAMKQNEYIVFSEAPKVSSDTMFVGKSNYRKDSTHAIAADYARSIYDSYGSYDIVYTKYTNFVIQYTYSKKFLEQKPREWVLRIIRTMGNISPYGYPEPLKHAHNATTIRSKIADIVADSLISQLGDDEYSDIMRLILSSTGRKMAGV